MINSTSIAFIKLTLVMVFWGLTFISGKLLGLSYHPYTIAFSRFFIASILLLTVLFIKNKQFYKVTKFQLLKSFYLSLSGVFFYNYFFLNGLKNVEAGRASVIIATNPALTTILAVFILKENFTIKKGIGVFLALLGAFFVISKGHPENIFQNSFGVGEISLFLAVASWVIYTIFGKLALKKLTPLEATTWASTIGTLILFPFAWKYGGPFNLFHKANLLDWINILNLGVLGSSLAFVWYYESINRIGVAQACSFINLIPIFAIISGSIFLKEQVTWSLIVGCTFVAIGIVFINQNTDSKDSKFNVLMQKLSLRRFR